ncbi:MAG TPA: arylesterase [Longimicrobiales bacterium]
MRLRVYGFWGAVCVALALAIVVAGCGKKPTLPRLASGDVIVAFGDSLTYGTGASERESYPAVLAQLIGREVVRSGVPGEVTAQGVQRLPEVLEEHRPRLVIVCLGGNDMLRRLSMAETRSNLHAIVKMLKERDIGVVLIGVPQPALLSSPPEFYAELAQEFGVPYEGEILKTVLYAAEMKADPIHPNARGYRKMAEAVAALLRQAGAI